jgi:hypothetical protein
MTKQLFFLLLLATLTSSVWGQVINSLSPDKTNLYFHGLDTVVRLARKTAEFHKVIVRGDVSIIDNFPDSVNGLFLDKKRASLPMDKIKLKEGEVIVTVRPVSIIRDEFKIIFIGAKKGERLGEGLYICYYKYIPESQTYELRKIKSGIVL